MSELLFVYGTLRRGCPHAMATRLAAEATHQGRAMWRGRLYDTGEHPVATPSDEDSDVVQGDLYRVTEETLAWLDLYEEVDDPPRPEWFVRRRTEVRLAGGEALEGWIYLFEGTPDPALVVSDGDYLNHLATVA